MYVEVSETLHRSLSVMLETVRCLLLQEWAMQSWLPVGGRLGTRRSIIFSHKNGLIHERKSYLFLTRKKGL